jgi:DNA-binding CsgD family transcriptional regulator
MYERDKELAEIRAAVEDARHGHGRALFVEGPAGIGKSALLDAARSAATRAGFRVLSASGAELEQGLPLGVAQQLLPETFQHEGDGGAPARRHAAMQGLHAQAVELAARRPLVVAVDDAHWADAASLQCIAYLARRMEGLRLLLVIAAGDLEPDADQSVLERIREGVDTSVLRPRPLSARGVARFVSGRFEAVASPAFARGCDAVTGGNPFLLRELVAALRADGVEPDDVGAAHVLEAAPEPVARAMLAHLRPLGPRALAVAEAAAVLAGDARLDRVATLAGVPIQDAAELADRLTVAGILRPGDPVAFRHPIVRTALHEHMPNQRRGLAHVAAAERLLADGEPRRRAATHLMAAPAGRREWVVCTLRDAAATASAAGAPELSVSLLRRALLDCGADCAGVLLELAEAELTTQDPAASTDARRAIGEATAPLERSRAALLAARALTATGRHDEAGEALAIVERESAALDATTRSAMRWQSLALTMVHSGVTAAAGALDESDGGGPLPLALRALERFSDGDDHERALQAARSVLAHGDVRAPDHQEALLSAARMVCLSDRLDEAREALDDLLEAGRLRGAVALVATANVLRAEAAYRAGDLAAAAADADAARGLAEQHGLAAVLAAAVQLTAELLLERDPGAAASLIERFDAESFPRGYAASSVMFARGRVAAAAGDLAAAADHFAACASARLAWGEHNPSACAWRSELALVQALRGRPDEAAGLAAVELGLARRFGALRAIGIALRARALLRTGSARSAGLQEAAVVLAQSPARLEHARVLADLGAEQRRSGCRGRARETLAQALDLAHACGADALAARCRAELVIAGARPRRERISGPESLTAGERRVAELAASGLTNRRIAQALFLTTKTVETHLSHTYMKLDISGRGELVEAMQAEAA